MTRPPAYAASQAIHKRCSEPSQVAAKILACVWDISAPSPNQERKPHYPLYRAVPSNRTAAKIPTARIACISPSHDMQHPRESTLHYRTHARRPTRASDPGSAVNWQLAMKLSGTESGEVKDAGTDRLQLTARASRRVGGWYTRSWTDPDAEDYSKSQLAYLLARSKIHPVSLAPLLLILTQHWPKFTGLAY
ncbi:hypothetical protein C8R44DRAFT_733047 [Mycena epipterygia]|nr:hypothetical protein C8R44DRAFT_733047 [Mycena epipterygia]